MNPSDTGTVPLSAVSVGGKTFWLLAARSREHLLSEASEDVSSLHPSACSTSTEVKVDSSALHRSTFSFLSRAATAARPLHPSLKTSVESVLSNQPTSDSVFPLPMVAAVRQVAHPTPHLPAAAGSGRAGGAARSRHYKYYSLVADVNRCIARANRMAAGCEESDPTPQRKQILSKSAEEAVRAHPSPKSHQEEGGDVTTPASGTCRQAGHCWVQPTYLKASRG